MPRTVLIRFAPNLSLLGATSSEKCHYTAQLAFRTVVGPGYERCNKADQKNVLKDGDFDFLEQTYLVPQQRKLMGSSAQISSGVCRCGSQEQVPEEGSGRFRRVPESSGVCWCRFRRQVPEGSGFVKWCKFRRQVPEGSGEFRCKMV